MNAIKADAAAIEAAILGLVAERGVGKTVCPSEVARAIGGLHPDGWGPLMQPVRRVAVRLAQAGRIAILRKGKPVDPEDFRGIYRLALPDAAGGSGSGSQSDV
ncbi:DUF3253 domain-containing protein [Methylobacterium sp. NEAU K]|uniref:DUF3253 domain-containing protein n=1 Tax=Methylobacterium sp. NEAU K TaxID=3064946 RepID=UPI0027361538|nr:DUF3253 domain-containing protein [Methylobacterium sp. NEAU K]MDP4003008.1 DUF3253 domain-containing protein [Methylobacterium sp. NEAU K]